MENVIICYGRRHSKNEKNIPIAKLPELLKDLVNRNEGLFL
jgi:hypothetical protein